MATLKRVCEQTPRPIQAFHPEIPSWLVKIIEKLHAKDPANRYDSAADVADLLGRCLAHVQQPASVPLPAELRPVRNRRAIALWGALPVCLMLAGLLSFPAIRVAAGQAASYMATVLRLKTPDGTLVVETDDPNVGIKLDGSELVVTGAGVKVLRLSVGKHSVQAVKDGRILRDELVTISRGGRTVLTVHREAEISTTTRSPAGAIVAPPVREQIVYGVPGEEVRRLAEMLKSDPPSLVTPSGGTKIFMRDLAAGQTTLIANTSVMGLPFAEQPDWSHDGRRILFRAKRTAQGPSTMIILESRDGRPSFRDIGSGDCPRFSPDDQTIAFVLYGDDTSGDVWLMNADGTNRRRLCEFAAPFWSPDGTQILLDGLLNPTISKVYSFATRQTAQINVPGQSVFSWPRWVAPGRIVACIGGGVVPDSIAILDISRPAEATVVRTLWNHDAASDVYARWPLISPSSGNLFFIGDERHMRTLFSLAPNADGPGRLSALEVGGPKLSGLSFSPDRRYLLFASDWLDSERSRGTAESTRNHSEPEVKRLAQ